MNRIKTSSTLILIVLIMAGSLILFIERATAQEYQDEVKLYLHRAGGGTMSTIPPVLDPRERLEIMTIGTTNVYNLTYPLTRELSITGNRSGSDMTMKLFLIGSTAIGVTPSHVLDVRVIEIEANEQENQIAANRFEGESMLEDELDLIFTSSSSVTLKEGSRLHLRIMLEGDSTLGFSYSYYGTPESSHISLKAEPIREEDLSLDLMDSEGGELEELLPNGPDSARTFDASVMVVDAFGAYDIEGINLLLSSGSGNSIWNLTDTPDESGGEMNAYLNISHTIPEGTPEGEYTLTVTVTSRTGQMIIDDTTLLVASGLQVTLQDPEREADAGSVLEFSVAILNGGEGTDRVTFSHNTKLGWSIEDPDPIEINGGDTNSVSFRVQVPIRSSLGDEDIIDLNIQSRNADKTYSREARVTVVSVAEFGVEVVGESTKAVVSGGGSQFSINIINIEDAESTFEVGVEDMPQGWSVSYSGSNGSTQGSLFILKMDGDSEGTVDMNIMTSSDSDGVFPISTFVRKQGETEKRSVYLKLRVVDPTRDVLMLMDTTDTKQSARVGSNNPIEYSEVFFTLEFYNPSLTESRIRINVFGPTGWDLEYDYGSLDLLPGESSSWNISIGPRDGELYEPDPYEVRVEVDGGSIGTFDSVLKVELKMITSIRIDPEKDVFDIVQGKEAMVNVSFINHGNYEAELDITLEFPDQLEISYETTTLTLQPEDQGTVRFKVKVMDAGDQGGLTFTIGYDIDGIKGSRDIAVFPLKEGSENAGPNFIWIGAAILAIIVIGAVGFFLYSKYYRTGENNKGPVPEKKNEPLGQVRISAVPQKSVESGRPVRPPRSASVEKADDIANSLLGEDLDKREISGGVTVEADRAHEVVTAEIME